MMLLYVVYTFLWLCTSFNPFLNVFLTQVSQLQLFNVAIIKLFLF